MNHHQQCRMLLGQSSTVVTRITFLASLAMLAFNIILLSKTTSTATISSIRIGSDFFSSFQPVEETVSIHDRQQQQQQQQQRSNDASHSSYSSSSSSTNSTNRRYPRTLMGIFSSDSYNDATYRGRHRKLLHEIWKDARVCTVHQFQHNATVRETCQLLYTFIIGGNTHENAPTELLEDTPDRPLTLPRMEDPTREDVNRDDVTLLNIK
jgi:hypothetical protein